MEQHNNSPYFGSPNPNSNAPLSTNFSSWPSQRQTLSPHQQHGVSGPPPMIRAGSGHSLPGGGSVPFYNSNPVSPNSYLNPAWSPQSNRTFLGEAHHTMARFAIDHDEPYSHLARNNRSQYRYSDPALFLAPTAEMGGYRTKPQSDIASNADSGYRTRDTRSVMSADYTKPLSEVPLPLGKLNLSEGPGQSVDGIPVTRPVAPPSTSSRKSGALKETWKCTRCGEELKCPSDYKKHMAKHDKPYRCDVPTCSRTEGFCTPNDLDRHKKSVHRIRSRPSKDYKCASPKCKHPEKLWPRLDNFKQHLNKMHPDEDFEDLLKRSTISNKPPLSSPIGPPSVMPMDAALAGTGAPKDYASSLNDTGISAEDLNWPMPLDPSNETFSDLHSAYSVTKPGTLEFESQPKDFPVTYDPNLMAQSSTVPGHNLSSFSQAESTQPQESHGLSALADIAVSHGSHALNHSLADPPGYAGSSSGLQSTRKQSGAQYELHSPTRRLGETSSHSIQTPRQKSLHTVIEIINKAMADISPTDKLVADNAAEIKDVMMKGLEEVLTKGQTGKKAPRGAHSTKQLNGKQCAKCNKVIPRDCDMRKHMKRHTRPYGCTYQNCNKRFGSKNDWKRHENSQHFQLEMWRCQVANRENKQTPCAEVFYTRESFDAHLKDSHKIASQETRDDHKKKFRLGRNGQSQFWCGFCRNILPLKSKGVNAWDERFSHIDNEHFKNKQDIRDWLCCVANKTKREVAKLMDKGNFNDDTSEKFASDGEGTGQRDFSAEPSRTGRGNGALMAGNDAQTYTRGRKRRADDPAEDDRHELWWICCQCDMGPFLAATNANCGALNPSCSHPFCENCSRKVHSAFE